MATSSARLRGPARVAAFTVAVVTAATAWADDWPQGRGPNRDGVYHETGVLEKFPREGLKVRWRAPVGPGWSSPVVAQGRVYLTDSQLSRPQAKERVVCCDGATGKLLWSYAYEVTYPDWAFTPRQEAGPTATPVVAGGRVYTLGGNGHIHCLDARNGKRFWDKQLEKQYRVEVLACRASPLIDGSRLILHVGGKPGACVVALDTDSGKEVWKALDESVTSSSPVIVSAGGKRQLVVWTQQSVTALDPATGKTWWRERLLTSNDGANATPVYQGNRLLVSGLMFKLDPFKPAASILWPDTKAVSRRVLSDTSTGLLQGDYVYSALSSGELVCLRADTGEEVWKTDKVTELRRGASIHLTIQGGAFLLYTDQGKLLRTRLTPQGYRELGSVKVLEPVYPFSGRNVAWSPPAYANRHIFARSEKELVCASLASHQ